MQNVLVLATRRAARANYQCLIKKTVFAELLPSTYLCLHPRRMLGRWHPTGRVHISLRIPTPSQHELSDQKHIQLV